MSFLFRRGVELFIGGGGVFTSTHTKKSAKTRKMKDIERYGIDIHMRKSTICIK